MELNPNSFMNHQPLDERLKKLQLNINSLNADQQRAVHHETGPLLVIAGAGSGKTQVATLRIARLISQGIDPRSIIGLTFTNKAAKEMQERVRGLIGSSILVSTFHSLGARILREFAHLIGYPSNFVIYDESDREKLVQSCLRRFQKDSDSNLLSKEAAIKRISHAKNSSSLSLEPDFNELFQLYQGELRKASAMDFDDLLYRTRDLLRDVSDVQSILQDRWRFILIDEYQDTNDVQSEIAVHIAGKSANIFAVGDPDQSIYSWRGANLQHILSFKDRFPGALEVRLEKNYRSTNIILQAANAVIQHNKHRIDKSLWSDRGSGHPILCHVARTERDEASYVIQGIQRLIEDGFSYSDIAILYRVNAQSRSFEDELMRKQLPYVIWGGLSFYQRKEIKDIIAYARLSFIPQDTIAFQRVINIPKRGIGASTIEKLTDFASKNSIPIITLILEIVRNNFSLSQFPELQLSLNVKQKKGLTEFCEIIQLLRNTAQSHSAANLISSAIHDTKYLEHLDDGEDDMLADRRENLQQLLARAMEWDDDWEKTNPDNKESSILQFFEMMSLETSVQESLQKGEKITVATIHNAKGLEFKAVFLVGLEEDLFPHINVKFKGGSDTELDIEEERRLMYVGMTRAKDILSLSLAQMRMLWGGFRNMKPSRFLYEIPQKYLEKVSYFPSIEEKKTFKKEIAENILPPTTNYKIGDIVLHANYGIGRVLSVTDSSLGLTYEIQFSQDGSIKKIIAQFAPLKKISS